MADVMVGVVIDMVSYLSSECVRLSECLQEVAT